MPTPSGPYPFPSLPVVDWIDWWDGAAIPAGTPFLLSPNFDYDVELNSFFLSGDMLCRAWNTQDGYARDLTAFLNFLWHNHTCAHWRNATAADHLAYLVWRRKDPAGPRIDDATWDREVTAVNRFYTWQVSTGQLADNPIPQRSRRPLPATAVRCRRDHAETTPATYTHGARREKVEWLPPATYRRWRDIGLRGYTSDELPNGGFRGRWAARNALFSDLMVRTGLRLAEQTALTVFEMPLDRGLGGYQRFWLPASIAKGGSARRVYVPESAVGEAIAYAEIDRGDVIEKARSAGRYRRWSHPFIVEDPNRPIARGPGGGQVKVARLDPSERMRLLIDGPNGLEPFPDRHQHPRHRRPRNPLPTNEFATTMNGPPSATAKFREACLTCPVFITTPDFLPQHREQLEMTHSIIERARQRGQLRVVEMNQRTADNLLTIITSLETPSPSTVSDTDDAS